MVKKIPVVVIKEISEVDKILPALKKDGIEYAEITFRTACAEQAIKYAVSLGKKGDVIFIAGKGAERYQEIGGIKYAYNDEEYIMQLVSENYII